MTKILQMWTTYCITSTCWHSRLPIISNTKFDHLVKGKSPYLCILKVWGFLFCLCFLQLIIFWVKLWYFANFLFLTNFHLIILASFDDFLPESGISLENTERWFSHSITSSTCINWFPSAKKTFPFQLSWIECISPIFTYWSPNSPMWWHLELEPLRGN